MSPEEQVERLVQFVNNLSGETIPKLELHIENLRREINNVRAHASDLSSQTVAHFQKQIAAAARKAGTTRPRRRHRDSLPAGDLAAPRTGCGTGTARRWSATVPTCAPRIGSDIVPVNPPL